MTATWPVEIGKDHDHVKAIGRQTARGPDGSLIHKYFWFCRVAGCEEYGPLCDTEEEAVKSMIAADRCRQQVFEW